MAILEGASRESNSTPATHSPGHDLQGYVREYRMKAKGQPLLRKIDCIRLFVPDLESGLNFYRDQLGHKLIWRTERAAGLRMPETDAEIVLQTEDQRQETDITVESADEAAKCFATAGGKVIVQPFDIQIGRCVVVEDPFGNPLVLLDISKGLLKTDSMGNVLGNKKR